MAIYFLYINMACRYVSSKDLKTFLIWSFVYTKCIHFYTFCDSCIHWVYMNKGVRYIWSLLGLAAAWMLERQIERSQPRAPRPARSLYEPRGEDPCVPTRLHGQTVVQTDLGPRRTANPTSLVIFVNLILPESWQHFSPRSLVHIHTHSPRCSDPFYILNLHIYEIGHYFLDTQYISI